MIVILVLIPIFFCLPNDVVIIGSNSTGGSDCDVFEQNVTYVNDAVTYSFTGSGWFRIDKVSYGCMNGTTETDFEIAIYKGSTGVNKNLIHAYSTPVSLVCDLSGDNAYHEVDVTFPVIYGPGDFVVGWYFNGYVQLHCSSSDVNHMKEDNEKFPAVVGTIESLKAAQIMLVGSVVCDEKYQDPSNGCACYLGEVGRLSDCSGCKTGFTMDSNCTKCSKTGFTMDSNCTKCNGNRNLATNCTTCVDYYEDISSDCSTCYLGDIGKTAACDGCKTGFSLGSNCTKCNGNRNLATNCTTCLDYYEDISGDCNTCYLDANGKTVGCDGCKEGYDLAMNCSKCSTGFLGFPTCMCNLDPIGRNEDCSGCEEGFDFGKNCSSCKGNRDLSKNCTTCDNYYMNLNNDCDFCPLTAIGRLLRCGGCKNGYDMSKNCSKCIMPFFSEEKSCVLCDGNRDEKKNCTKCKVYFDRLEENCLCYLNDEGMEPLCTGCKGGYDVATNCSSCIAGRIGYPDECVYPQCGGIASYMKPPAYNGSDPVCMGRGDCINTNECDCFDKEKFMGENCSVPICFGKYGNNACSGKGECIGRDNGANYCKCKKNREGNQCQDKEEFSSVGAIIGIVVASFFCVIVLVCLCLCFEALYLTRKFVKKEGKKIDLELGRM